MAVATIPMSISLLTPDTFHPALKDLDDLPCLPLDQLIPPSALRRRHAISSSADSPPLVSKPRMKRRGAISYDQTDASAMYIRYLVEALAKRDNSDIFHENELSELPTNELFTISSIRTRGRRGSIHSSTPSKCYRELMKGSIIDSIGVEGAINDSLRNVDSWDFDIFAFTRIAQGRPLLHMGLHLFQLHGLCDKFQLDTLKLYKFLAQVEDNYHPENSYHNSTHASDVAQALHCLISDPAIYNCLSPEELLSIFLAAICHDLDHPGVNQNYLINTSSYLAAIHGNHSLLERHHCQTTRATLKESGLLDNIPAKEEILTLIEDLILATDVNRHKSFMTRFEEMLVSDSINLSNQLERHFILMMAIKCADVSNPARRLNLSKQWSHQIMEEFFKQGDMERELNLPISFLCDRTTTAIPKSQSGFFEFFALPLFKAWSKFIRSPLSVRMCCNIANNKQYWENHSS